MVSLRSQDELARTDIRSRVTQASRSRAGPSLSCWTSVWPAHRTTGHLNVVCFRYPCSEPRIEEIFRFCDTVTVLKDGTRVPPWFYLFATAMIALGTTLSAFWIMVN